MAILKYKGVEFEACTKDNDGHYWGEICEECAEKQRDIFDEELDDGGTAQGWCSVRGCSNHGYNAKKHYYIDFKDELISFVER